jgi:hypothetical protein
MWIVFVMAAYCNCLATCPPIHYGYGSFTQTPNPVWRLCGRRKVQGTINCSNKGFKVSSVVVPIEQGICVTRCIGEAGDSNVLTLIKELIDITCIQDEAYMKIVRTLDVEAGQKTVGTYRKTDNYEMVSSLETKDLRLIGYRNDLFVMHKEMKIPGEVFSGLNELIVYERVDALLRRGLEDTDIEELFGASTVDATHGDYLVELNGGQLFVEAGRY